MNEMKISVEYVKGYTIALLCLGLFLLLGALQLGMMPGADAAFSFMTGILCLVGLSCVTVALLRWMRSPAALPATTAVSLLLFLAFPVGTILAFYWLSSVKPREPKPDTDPWSAWFNYTVMLYILGLVLLDAGLGLRLLLEEDGVVNLISWGMLAVGAAALAIGALRSSSFRGGHLATLVFNGLIVFWFPLGTVLALIWFFAFRKDEKEILSGGGGALPQTAG